MKLILKKMKVITIILAAVICFSACSSKSSDSAKIDELQKQVNELQAQLEDHSETTNETQSTGILDGLFETTDGPTDSEFFLANLEIGPLPSRVTLENMYELVNYEIESFELTTEPRNRTSRFVELHYNIVAKSLNEHPQRTKVGDFVYLPAHCYDSNGTLVDSFAFSIREAGYGEKSSYGAYINLPEDTTLLVFNVEGSGDIVPGTGTYESVDNEVNAALEGIEQIIEDNVAIRSAASIDSDIVGFGRVGDMVEVIQDCDNEYTKIFYQDNYCYIQDRFISNSKFENRDEFICPLSYREFLTYNDIGTLSDHEIRLALNEIYARRGRKFINQEIMNYFLSKEWYVPQFEPDEFDNNIDYYLNSFERENIRFLSK